MYKTILCLGAGLLFASAASADKLVPFKAAENMPVLEEPGAPCSFAPDLLPKDTIVLAAGGYSGQRLDYSIDETGNPASLFKVAVHADRPVALLLGAYEPSIWNIGWSKGTKIVAVFASGHHPQAVAGLPKGTPIITSTAATCGAHYVSTDSLDWVNTKAREVFGQPAERVYHAKQGVIDIVESRRAPSGYATSRDTPAKSFINQNVPLAGKAGLQAAVRNGQLRPLTKDDLALIREHYRKLAAAEPPRDIPPSAGAAPAPRLPIVGVGGYVVLKEFVFPGGLYGGYSTSFLVPEGVPSPSGNPGHSIVVDLNKTPPCQGVRCP